jgi:2-hydroxychromene-2-carboxylate isomerase
MAKKRRKSTRTTRRRKRGTPRPKQRSTAKGVKRLKSSSFAYPKTRKYPINTKKRARAALAYAARSDTAGTYAHVARKVRKKYPGIKIGGKKKK